MHLAKLTRPRLLLTAALVPLAAFYPSLAKAQATPGETSEDAARMNSNIIIVTAQKREQDVNEVPLSITAIGGDDLTRQGIGDVADLVKVVPGFNFTPGAYGTDVYSIRGIGFYTTEVGASPTVSTYVDQIPLPYPALNRGSSLDVERVEVLKGPQGTLFGQNATGGAVNFVASKPTSSLSAGADLSYGRFNSVDAEAFVSGPISETLGIRVAVGHQQNDDWQYNYLRNDTIGEKDILLGRVLLEWQPGLNTTITLNANAWRERSDNQAAQLLAVLLPDTANSPLIGYPLPPENNRAADWGPVSDIDGPSDPFGREEDFVQVSGRLDQDIGENLRAVVLASYIDFSRESFIDFDGTALEIIGIGSPADLDSTFLEARLEGEFGRARWIAGGNYERTNSDEFAEARLGDRLNPFDTAITKNFQDIETWAIFGNAEFDLTDSLTISGGVRYTESSIDFSGGVSDTGDGGLAFAVGRLASARKGETVTIAPGSFVTLNANFDPEEVFKSLNEDNLSWRGSIDWEATPDLLLYASVAKGYKAGSFPAIAAIFEFQLEAATQESVLAYEAGFKAGIGPAVQFNGAFFRYDYTDKQVRGKVINPLLGPQNALVNIPESRINGLELQVSSTPTRDLSLALGFSYIDSKILGDFVNFNALGDSDNLSGESFPLAPEIQFTGSFDYDFLQISDAVAFIGGNFVYQSETNGGLGELEVLEMDDYLLVDFRLGVRNEAAGWRVMGFVRNAFDETYYTLAQSAASEVASGFRGRPRTYGLQVSFKY